MIKQVFDYSAFYPYTESETIKKFKCYATVADMWEESSKQWADNDAIVYGGQTYTYKRLAEDVALFRTALVNAGVKKGERVGIFSPNSYETVKAFLAVTTLGCTAAILPAHLEEAAVYGCSLKFALKAIVYASCLAQKTSLCAAQNPALMLIGMEQNATVPTPAASVKKDDDCVILFTGGTTGKSKGALLTNGAITRGIYNGLFGYKDVFNQRYMLVLPLSHVFGLVRNLGTSLQTGSCLYICQSPKDMFRDAAVFNPTMLVAVPALVELGVNLSKQFKRNMFGSAMKVIITGAAVLNPYLVRECKNMGISLLEGYGLTESANLVSGNPQTLEKPTSVGIPYAGQQLRVEDGELWIKGENMMKCYVGEPEENAAAIEDGWFKTGDLVKFDEDGYLYIVGRKKEIIILPNGENVSPAEVEEKFNALDIVQDSQVFEDTNGFNQPILALEVVARATELNKVEAEDKNAYLISKLQEINRTLPAFQQVSKITVRDTDFARTPAMKIIRYKKV